MRLERSARSAGRLERAGIDDRLSRPASHWKRDSVLNIVSEDPGTYEDGD
jgi:hypothetical protein